MYICIYEYVYIYICICIHVSTVCTSPSLPGTRAYMYIYIHTYVTWKQKQPIVVSMHGRSEIPCLCQFVASKRFPFIAHIEVLMYPSKANKHKYVLINMVYHD